MGLTIILFLFTKNKGLMRWNPELIICWKHILCWRGGGVAKKSLYFRPGLLVFWISDIELCQPKAWDSVSFQIKFSILAHVNWKMTHSYCWGCFRKTNRTTLPFITIKPSVILTKVLHSLLVQNAVRDTYVSPGHYILVKQSDFRYLWKSWAENGHCHFI